MYKYMGFKWHNRALLKILMSDPRHQLGILYGPNKSFLAGNTFECQGFLESSAPDASVLEPEPEPEP
jgi:hypothetical protein